jgi:hypothetical protein
MQSFLRWLVSDPVSGDDEVARIASEPSGRGAAFFDLDKTLMQGSSGFQFARAVREAGLISRRQLVSDAMANMRFRLHGAGDEEAEALRIRIATEDADNRVRPSGRRQAGVHSHGGRPGHGSGAREGDDLRRRARLGAR